MIGENRLGGEAMTEAEWLTATDPTPMLKSLRNDVSERKLRLFGVACCRRHWQTFTDERSRTAVGVGERLADGLAADLEREASEGRASQAVQAAVLERYTNYTLPEHFIIAARAARFTVMPCGTFDLEAGLATVAACRLMVLHATGDQASRADENAELCSTIRDIFGPLSFRPMTVDPAWLTSAVLALAEGIYDERTFDRMPILADALQDAGCDNEEILNHCRQPGEHVRGCWVVDMILGKQ
jgi:hypothetical protein